MPEEELSKLVSRNWQPDCPFWTLCWIDLILLIETIHIMVQCAGP
jgi:hypothetical protein